MHSQGLTPKTCIDYKISSRQRVTLEMAFKALADASPVICICRQRSSTLGTSTANLAAVHLL